jgi:alpha-ketoglutarate-dependent taurine dioxygenase
MFEVTHISERAGSRIDIGRDDLLSGKYAAEIERLIVERSALVFPAMGLSGAEQLQFAATIGKIVPHGEDGLSKISMDPAVNPVADYTRGAFYWHIDGANDKAPAKATMLTAIVLADDGGDTLICNTYAAYEDLPEDDKALIARLKVRHTLETSQRLVRPQPGLAELMAWQSYPAQSHPLVWKHRHGRTSLVLGASAHYVEGMSIEEGNLLLCRLLEFVTQEQYVYRHKWTVGDLLVWDNTGTMHRADEYALDSKRLMNRTTLHGEEPLS